jgi:hypothetical protein
MSMHPGELANLQAAYTPRLTAQATVHRKQQARDSSGGFTDNYVVIATYPCSFAPYPMRPRDVPSFPRVQQISEWYFSFPDGSDVQNTDRLTVGTRLFEVDDSGPRSFNILLLVIAKEIV